MLKAAGSYPDTAVMATNRQPNPESHELAREVLTAHWTARELHSQGSKVIYDEAIDRSLSGAQRAAEVMHFLCVIASAAILRYAESAGIDYDDALADMYGEIERVRRKMDRPD